MSKNVTVNENDYFGVSVVRLPVVGGGTADFRDVDEIITPSGEKNITENGTYDVSAFARAIVAVAATESSGGGVAVTQFTIEENADRSLWFNAQGIKLVRGINLLISEKWLYNASKALNQGAVNFVALLWDGVAESGVNSTEKPSHHLRGMSTSESAYTMIASAIGLVKGSTSAVSVAEDGTLSFETSATDVTTGNYNNSSFEGGCTYYLIQIPSDTVC